MVSKMEWLSIFVNKQVNIGREDQKYWFRNEVVGWVSCN